MLIENHGRSIRYEIFQNIKGHGALRSNSWFVIPGKTIGPIFLKFAWITIGPKTLSLIIKSLGSSFVLMWFPLFVLFVLAIDHALWYFVESLTIHQAQSTLQNKHKKSIYFDKSLWKTPLKMLKQQLKYLKWLSEQR